MKLLPPSHFSRWPTWESLKRRRTWKAEQLRLGIQSGLLVQGLFVTPSTPCAQREAVGPPLLSVVAAVKVMPIADALAIVFVEPFVILLIGRLVLGEQVGPRRLAACAVGFAGSLIVIQPSFVQFGPVALFPLGTAVTFALYMLVTRRLSRDLHPVPMQLHTAVVAAILCLPVLALGTKLGEPSLTLVMPQGINLVWVICVGLASAFSG